MTEQNSHRFHDGFLLGGGEVLCVFRQFAETFLDALGVQLLELIGGHAGHKLAQFDDAAGRGDFESGRYDLAEDLAFLNTTQPERN